MTWPEIVEKYPDQYVALTNVFPDKYNIETADVIHSENDLSEYEL